MSVAGVGFQVAGGIGAGNGRCMRPTILAPCPGGVMGHVFCDLFAPNEPLRFEPRPCKSALDAIDGRLNLGLCAKLDTKNMPWNESVHSPDVFYFLFFYFVFWSSTVLSHALKRL